MAGGAGESSIFYILLSELFEEGVFYHRMEFKIQTQEEKPTNETRYSNMSYRREIKTQRLLDGSMSTFMF